MLLPEPSDALNYIESLFTCEEDFLLKKTRSRFSDKRNRIQLSPVEGKILYMLIKMNSIEKVVEVGTLGGYSALWIAKAIPKHGMVYTIEKNKHHAEIAKQNFSEYNGDNITLLEGSGLSELSKLEESHDGLFDMMFIDADKSGYCDYLDWAEKNVRKGGLIVADNTLLFNTVFLKEPSANISVKSWRIMNEFNNRVSDTEKYDSILFPTTEGLTVAIKK